MCKYAFVVACAITAFLPIFVRTCLIHLLIHSFEFSSHSTVAANLDYILAKNLAEDPIEPIVENSENSIESFLDELYDNKKEEGAAAPIAIATTVPAPLPSPVPLETPSSSAAKTVQLPGSAQYSDSIVICGSDSDILLQAMILSSKFPNIRVLQSG